MLWMFNKKISTKASQGHCGILVGGRGLIVLYSFRGFLFLLERVLFVSYSVSSPPVLSLQFTS